MSWMAVQTVPGWIEASYETVLLLARWTPVLFVFALGACVGSLINVIAYRVPLGLDIVSPPSRCPSCETRLTWRENIPIFGWLFWRGRCRYCKSPISPEYPLVELAVAMLFAGLYVLWYVVPDPVAYAPDKGVWLGVNWSAVKPEWAQSGAGLTWPAFVVCVSLVGSLAAMTLVDAKTFTIPLFLPWFATIVALVVHPLHALWVQKTIGHLPRVAPGWLWTIPTPAPRAPSEAWWWIGACGGAVSGLGVSLLLVRMGLIRRSFADYDEWEQQQTRRLEQERAASGQPAPGADAGGENPTDLWVAYPHARREMVKELAFLGPPALLGMAGGWLAHRLTDTAGPVVDPETGAAAIASGPVPSLWLLVLAGVVLGYLVGGALVWGVRIFGSLAFGKEAMGLGDVHLMAAVGACLGWIDTTLAFFAAAFVGLFWAVVVGPLSGGKVPRALPYGPYLAIATCLVMLTKPLIERLITLLAHAEVPINIP